MLIKIKNLYDENLKNVKIKLECNYIPLFTPVFDYTQLIIV